MATFNENVDKIKAVLMANINSGKLIPFDPTIKVKNARVIALIEVAHETGIPIFTPNDSRAAFFFNNLASERLGEGTVVAYDSHVTIVRMGKGFLVDYNVPLREVSALSSRIQTPINLGLRTGFTGNSLINYNVPAMNSEFFDLPVDPEPTTPCPITPIPNDVGDSWEDYPPFLDE